MSSMTRIALALLVTFLGTGCSVSRTQPVARAAAPPARHVLPNGVRVVIQEHSASEVVALQLWVKAGVRDEAESELGLAHYLEHMLFKGTASRPRGFIERAGFGWDYPERYARALEAVSVLDVTRVARRYLANPTTVVVRPPS